MHSQIFESMRDQVAIIYRALTGADIPESQAATTDSDTPFEQVARSFAELEASARAIPSLAERLPPFSFTPALDARFDGDDLVIEIAVPGVERNDVTVKCSGDDQVEISGIRRAHRGFSARAYAHSEIPCGPFYRAFRVPFTTHGEPAIDLEQGLLRIRLSRAPAQTQAQEVSETSNDTHPKHRASVEEGGDDGNGDT